jgi:hypothetical protein
VAVNASGCSGFNIQRATLAVRTCAMSGATKPAADENRVQPFLRAPARRPSRPQHSPPRPSACSATPACWRTAVGVHSHVPTCRLDARVRGRGGEVVGCAGSAGCSCGKACRA